MKGASFLPSRREDVGIILALKDGSLLFLWHMLTRRGATQLVEFSQLTKAGRYCASSLL